MTLEVNKQAVRAWLDAVNRRDADAVRALTTEDFRFRAMHQAPDYPRYDWGREEFAEWAGRPATGFAESPRLTLTSMVAEGDRVTAEVTGGSLLQDGRRCDHAYQFAVEFSDGRLKEVREYRCSPLIGDRRGVSEPSEPEPGTIDGSTVERMAASLRESYAGSFLEGILGPVNMFADRVQTGYVPPRSTDGWFDRQALVDYQYVEERGTRAVLPDARLTDVKVVTRADDQIIVVFTLRGHLRDGRLFEMPTTFVYDVRGNKIVRVTGLYDQERLAPFTEAFEEAAKAHDMDVLVEVAPPRAAPSNQESKQSNDQS